MESPTGRQNGLRVQVEDDVAFLTLERAARRNALSLSLLQEISEAFLKLARSDTSRAIVIQSAHPGMFCAGADVKEYAEHADDIEWRLMSKRAVEAAAAAVARARVPTIAVVDGPCIGAGMSLIIACDIRLAGPNARFAIPSTRLGYIYPFADTQRLIQNVGTHHARYLLLTGETMAPGQALRLGIIDEIYENAADLRTRLGDLLAHFRSQPTASAATKRYVDAARAESTETDELTSLYRQALAGGRENADAGLGVP